MSKSAGVTSSLVRSVRPFGVSSTISFRATCLTKCLTSGCSMATRRDVRHTGGHMGRSARRTFTRAMGNCTAMAASGDDMRFRNKGTGCTLCPM